MSVNNGDTANADTFNTSFMSREVDTGTVAKVTLARPGSGATVVDVQLEINTLKTDTAGLVGDIDSLKKDEKNFVKTSDNSVLSWAAPNLSFSGDIEIHMPDVGVINKILVANSPLVIADGESVYFTLDRAVNTNLTPVIGAPVPTGVDVFRFCTRIGDDIIFNDNTLLRDGYSARLGGTPEPFVAAGYERVHVSVEFGNDATADGTEQKPYQTIQAAINSLGTPTATNKRIVKIAAGDYTSQGLVTVTKFTQLLGEGRDVTFVGPLDCSAGNIYISHLDLRGNISGFGSVTPGEPKNFSVMERCYSGPTVTITAVSDGYPFIYDSWLDCNITASGGSGKIEFQYVQNSDPSAVISIDCTYEFHYSSVNSVAITPGSTGKMISTSLARNFLSAQRNEILNVIGSYDDPSVVSTGYYGLGSKLLLNGDYDSEFLPASLILHSKNSQGYLYIDSSSSLSIGTNAAFGSRAIEIWPNDTKAATFETDGSTTFEGPAKLKSYTVAGVPAAGSHTGSLIFVSDETGGPVAAYSDGTDWRRVTDGAVIS